MAGTSVLTSVGDEVVINQSNTNSEVTLGDCECSPYRLSNGELFEFSEARFNSPSQVSAGELWEFFDQQGIESLDHLVICMDVDQLTTSQRVALSTFELLIEDPASSKIPDYFSLGGNSLVVAGEGTSDFHPECRIEVSLGYDFMQRFSKDSKEKLKLNIGLDNQSASFAPTFSIEGKRQLFTIGNLILLGIFCLFWTVVFFLLKRYTLPSAKRLHSQPVAVQK